MRYTFRIEYIYIYIYVLFPDWGGGAQTLAVHKYNTSCSGFKAVNIIALRIALTLPT